MHPATANQPAPNQPAPNQPAPDQAAPEQVSVVANPAPSRLHRPASPELIVGEGGPAEITDTAMAHVGTPAPDASTARTTTMPDPAFSEPAGMFAWQPPLRRSEPAPPPVEITVTIGRIEVRGAPPPPAAPAAPAAPRRARLTPSSLDDYLRARSSGRLG